MGARDIDPMGLAGLGTGHYGGGRYGGGRYGGNLPKGGHYGGSILPYNQYIFICTYYILIQCNVKRSLM